MTIPHIPARYDHVGSFLRPAYLLQAREQKAKGAITAEQLRKQFDAVGLTLGAEQARELPISGRELKGVHLAMRSGMLAAPYSTGEIMLLRPENGTRLWSNNIVMMRKTDRLADFPNIAALPVIDHGAVIAV